MPKAKERELGFEDSLSNLEKIVAQLESGDLPLEKALELFETGVGLARRCQLQLEDAEQKVELLLRERGEIKVIPFEMAKETQVGLSDKAERPPDSGVNATAKPAPQAEDETEDPDDRVPF